MDLLPQPLAARWSRAELILEAAATLLLRHGYGRITMEDVAQQAGVGTGTLYLHWKTKEALFETVLLRELVAIWTQLAHQLDADPNDALLHRFLAHLLRAVKERPLARALFTRDSSLLGKLAQRSVVMEAQPVASGAQFISHLRELGLMRDDIDLATQAYAFSAIWAGFSLGDPLLSGDDRVPLDIQVAALTAAIRSTFEPDSPPDAAALRSYIAPAIQRFLGQARAALEQQIQARALP